MPSITLNVQQAGLEIIQRRLTEFARSHPTEVAKALINESKLIMRESFYEVPVDTDSLRHSGFVEPPVISARNISITLGYGGAAVKLNPKSGELTTEYAITVHENTLQPHRVGKAKFLYDPIMRNAARLAERLSDDVQRLLTI